MDLPAHIPHVLLVRDFQHVSGICTIGQPSEFSDSLIDATDTTDFARFSRVTDSMQPLLPSEQMRRDEVANHLESLIAKKPLAERLIFHSSSNSRSTLRMSLV